jgi:hypothetical protein
LFTSELLSMEVAGERKVLPRRHTVGYAYPQPNCIPVCTDPLSRDAFPSSGFSCAPAPVSSEVRVRGFTAQHRERERESERERTLELSHATTSSQERGTGLRQRVVRHTGGALHGEDDKHAKFERRRKLAARAWVISKWVYGVSSAILLSVLVLVLKATTTNANLFRTRWAATYDAYTQQHSVLQKYALIRLVEMDPSCLVG